MKEAAEAFSVIVVLENNVYGTPKITSILGSARKKFNVRRSNYRSR